MLPVYAISKQKLNEVDYCA